MTSYIRRLFGSGEGTEHTMVPSGDTGRRLADVPEGQLTYQEAKRFARDGDVGIRQALASRQDVPPEILYFLADDPESSVRRAIVRNHSTPALAHLVLVDDQDDTVRADLAERIVRLAPGLTSDERDRARQTAYRVLERLVRDQLPRVRQIISEALKDVADAPPEIINRLARDVEEAVSTPVLEFSPVLRDEDLLDIIGENPSSAALSAISRRNRVGADVSDAIAATDDAAAIAILLANPSAQIREETLDALITRSEVRPEWQEPLVRRPDLSGDAATRLARFVADRLIEVLVERQDLGAETLAEVKRVVHQRLSGASSVAVSRLPRSVPFGGAAVSASPVAGAAGSVAGALSAGAATSALTGGKSAAAASVGTNEGRPEASRGVSFSTSLQGLFGEKPDQNLPLPVSALNPALVGESFLVGYQKALTCYQKGALDEDMLLRALKHGEDDFLKAALAIRADLYPDVVLSLFQMSNPRGLVALVWKAGLSPAWSQQIQTHLARLSYRDVIAPQPGLPYGLAESEMDWLIKGMAKNGVIPVGSY